MKKQYLVVGRICDHENHHKVVNGESEDAAQNAFEQYVREIEGVEGNDFYIDHCMTLEEMATHSIN